MKLSSYLGSDAKAVSSRRAIPMLESLEDRTLLAGSLLHSLPVFSISGGASATVHAASINASVSANVQASINLENLVGKVTTALDTLTTDLQTLQGQLANIGTMALADAQALLTSTLNTVESDLSRAIGAVNGAANALTTQVGGKLKHAAQLLSNVLHDVSSSLSAVSHTVDTLVTQVSGLTADTIAAFSARVDTLLTNAISDAGDLSSALDDFVTGGVTDTTNLLNTVFTEVNNSLVTAGDALNTLTDEVTNAAVTTTDAAQALLASVLSDVNSIVGTIQNSLNTIKSALTDAAKMAVGDAQELLQSSLSDLQDNLNTIADGLNALGNAVATNLNGTLGTASQVVDSALGNLADDINTLAGSLDALIATTDTPLSKASLQRLTKRLGSLLQEATGDLNLFSRAMNLVTGVGNISGGTLSALHNAIDALFARLGHQLDLIFGKL